MDSPIINPIPVCEAKTGFDRTDPFAAVYCYQTRGLRKVIDANGHAHWFCAANGHGENVRVRVRRNYGMAPDAPGVMTATFGR